MGSTICSNHWFQAAWQSNQTLIATCWNCKVIRECTREELFDMLHLCIAIRDHYIQDAIETKSLEGRYRFEGDLQDKKRQITYLKDKILCLPLPERSRLE